MSISETKHKSDMHNQLIMFICFHIIVTNNWINWKREVFFFDILIKWLDLSEEIFN